MKTLKIPLKDSNNKQLYHGDAVKIDGEIYIVKFCDEENKEYWFLKEGAAWRFDLGKVKVEKI